MAVESDVAVVLGGSEEREEPKEALSRQCIGEVVDGGDNGCGGENGGHGLGDDGGGSVGSKTGSNSSDDPEPNKNKIRILVSSRKKPVFFYINLAKKYLNKSYDVELSALGMAIPTVITVSEYLKRNGLGVQKNIRTSSITKINDEKGRAMVKPQMEILLVPCAKLEEALVDLSVS